MQDDLVSTIVGQKRKSPSAFGNGLIPPFSRRKETESLNSGATIFAMPYLWEPLAMLRLFRLMKAQNNKLESARACRKKDSIQLLPARREIKKGPHLSDAGLSVSYCLLEGRIILSLSKCK
jgi:hypothetical protein